MLTISSIYISFSRTTMAKRLIVHAPLLFSIYHSHIFVNLLLWIFINKDMSHGKRRISPGWSSRLPFWTWLFFFTDLYQRFITVNDFSPFSTCQCASFLKNKFSQIIYLSKSSFYGQEAIILNILFFCGTGCLWAYWKYLKANRKTSVFYGN